MKRVYLDYAATTPVKEEVLAAMLPYFKSVYGNPSSIHAFGREAKKAVEEGRKTIADFLGTLPSEIYFTASGSESDNLAIKGLLKELSKGLGSPHSLSATHSSPVSNSPSAIRDAGTSLRGIPSADMTHHNFLPHIITSQIEHHAVLHACQEVERLGLAEVTYLKPTQSGIIEVKKIKKAIKKNTVLVSIMYINNEVGTVEPIREIGKEIERINKLRIKNSKIDNSKFNNSKIYFHTDAVQAAGSLPMNVDFLHVDLLTIAGHKIGAPKGIGALYIRKGINIKPIINGGEQERGLRAGTENVAYIVGLAKAISEIKKEDGEKVSKLRDYFIKRVNTEIDEAYVNGIEAERAPHIANLYFRYIEGESIVLALDLKGIASSTGSACTSSALEPSHVLMAMFNEPMRASSSVRFSFGKETKKADIDLAVEKIKEVVKRLRAISPYN